LRVRIDSGWLHLFEIKKSGSRKQENRFFIAILVIMFPIVNDGMYLPSYPHLPYGKAITELKIEKEGIG
jgi:hypothetical protein